MPIPESQLVTWSNQGAITTAKATHEAIRTALTHRDSPIANLIDNGSVTVYLQGSYKNDTNIRGDSDVDVVVELNTTFGHNARVLPQEQKTLHEYHYSDPVTYDWATFRNDVVRALTTYFGGAVIDARGNKSIKLLPVPGRVKADIVPVVYYREYSFFADPSNYHAEEGIMFYHRTTNAAITNFPQQHYDNGVSKNAAERTNGRFKPTVRIFKNARSYLVDKGLLSSDKAPSYFLQGLVYSAPDHCFEVSHQKTFENVLQSMLHTPMNRFVCQNELHPLIGASPYQWNTDDAVTTIQALKNLSDNWYSI